MDQHTALNSYQVMVKKGRKRGMAKKEPIKDDKGKKGRKARPGEARGWKEERA